MSNVGYSPFGVTQSSFGRTYSSFGSTQSAFQIGGGMARVLPGQPGVTPGQPTVTPGQPGVVPRVPSLSSQSQTAQATHSTVQARIMQPNSFAGPINQSVLTPGSTHGAGMIQRDALGLQQLNSFSKDLSMQPQPGMASTRCCASGTRDTIPLSQVSSITQTVPMPLDTKSPNTISNQFGYLRS